jgi:hypothetical protein
MVAKLCVLAIAGSCLFASSDLGIAGPKEPECSATVRVDLERDGKLDCVAVQVAGADAVLKVRLSSSSRWVELARYKHSDEVLSVVSLAGYQNPRFTASRKGHAIRLTFPEKSSVLYYWDKKKSAMAEFWESD